MNATLFGRLDPSRVSDGSCGASIVGDPELGPIADTSPALDAADLVICGDPPVDSYDSYGPNRPNGDECDLGSWKNGAISPFSDGFESGDTSGWWATVP